MTPRDDMSPHPTFVIVGASLAGDAAAAALREAGFDGRIVLVGSELERPYERPPLPKDLLRGESARARVFLRSASFYEEQAIELRLGHTVTAIDPGERTVTFGSGERLAWDRLLIATGSEPRWLDLPGAELTGVVTLRTLDD